MHALDLILNIELKLVNWVGVEFNVYRYWSLNIELKLIIIQFITWRLLIIKNWDKASMKLEYYFWPPNSVVDLLFLVVIGLGYLPNLCLTRGADLRLKSNWNITFDRQILRGRLVCFCLIRLTSLNGSVVFYVFVLLLYSFVLFVCRAVFIWLLLYSFG